MEYVFTMASLGVRVLAPTVQVGPTVAAVAEVHDLF
jgi:hypothetical protein